MKKSNLLLFFFACLFSIAGCKSELVEPALPADAEQLVFSEIQQATACTNHYYYDGPERVEIGQVLNDRIVVGFPDGTTAQQKNRILSQFSFIDSIESSYHSGSADVAVVLLQPSLSCTQVEKGLRSLGQHPGIRFANPVFNNFQGPWDNGITNQIIIAIRPEYSRADLEQVARRYQVQVVDDFGDNTYVLSVDKRSRVSTLQAMNLIAQHAPDKVLSCSPDFLFLPAKNFEL
jgi:hypothetical protein